ncbi:MAG: FAD-binding oxidoreductase, partial [Bryobacteraceae bacterium]
MSGEAAWCEDASGFRGHAERSLRPSSEEEIAAVLREAAASHTPVTVAGAGTGVAGGRVPQGGWVLSTENLRALEVHPGCAVAGAGVSLRDLHDAAAASGQLYGPDPTETTASIGGNIATNASGARSFRYGDTRRNVLRLRVVLMDGAILDLRRGQIIDFDVTSIPAPNTTKHAAGFPLAPGMDWIDLFIGSEGTLGVVTEIEVKLATRPRALLSGVLF